MKRSNDSAALQKYQVVIIATRFPIFSAARGSNLKQKFSTDKSMIKPYSNLDDLGLWKKG